MMFATKNGYTISKIFLLQVFGMRGRKVCGFLFALAIALLGSQTLGFDSVQITKTFNPIFNFSPLHRKECIPSRKSWIKRVHMRFV
jgi:hypothetical protein